MNKGIEFLSLLIFEKNRHALIERNIFPLTRVAVGSGIAAFFIGFSSLAAIFALDDYWPILGFSLSAWTVVTGVYFFYVFSSDDQGGRKVGHANPKTRGPSTTHKKPEKTIGRMPAYPEDKRHVVLANTHRSIAIMPEGLTRDILVALEDAINDGNVDLISARSIDAAGVLTRDPACNPNAGMLVDWLKKPSYALVKPEGNSRYSLTRIGRHTLTSIPR